MSPFFKKDFIYLFLDRGEGKEKERERNINVWSSLMGPPLETKPGLQPRHVPWLGIEPMTLWLTGWHSIHWATTARAELLPLKGNDTLFLTSNKPPPVYSHDTSAFVEGYKTQRENKEPVGGRDRQEEHPQLVGTFGTFQNSPDAPHFPWHLSCRLEHFPSGGKKWIKDTLQSTV